MSDQVIDSYFIYSDLEDIPISEAEKVEGACYDSQSETDNQDDDIPVGLRVY